MAETNIVVIGAGVSGLTTALILAKKSQNKITIVAKHMPGDYDIEYASPWAGANYSPFAKAGTLTATWEQESWQPLADLADNFPEAGVHFQKSVTYARKQDTDSSVGTAFADFFSADPWYKNIVRNFRSLTPGELPAGVTIGNEFVSLQINTALYLPYLVGQCRKHGVVLKRGILNHVIEAKKEHHSGKIADIVVNCTGLSSYSIGGVSDKTMSPARGQVVLVRNDPGLMVMGSASDAAEDELLYIMTRASGGGTIIGGSYQLGNWDPNPDPKMALRILQRAVEVQPEMAGGKGVEGLSIIRHAVGLRPYRKDGIRLEKEKIDGTWVIHNYGHAGYGYQVSFGCSYAVEKLVDSILQSKSVL